MKPISTSVYTFQDLIEGGFLYVDKTEFVYQLVRYPKGLNFLSRPRRFGKSLLLSTLKAYFLGRRDLFEGLALYDKPVRWKRYPIIHIDLGPKEVNSSEDLQEFLRNRIDLVAQRYGISLSRSSYEERFQELIERLSAKGEKVVILIDEYDKPILSNIANPQIGEILRTLKSFYAVIKATEPYQRFVLLTGVSKFSKVSVFSDLNNLTDLTMAAPYATALGYTQNELESNFAPLIAELAAKEGISYEDILEKIRSWYNGYRFEEGSETVYNPVSVMSCLSAGKFSNYWFETGTPHLPPRSYQESGVRFS